MNGAYWTRDEDQALRDGIAARETFAAIGKALGRSGKSCSTRARRLGIYTPQAPAPSIWTPQAKETLRRVAESVRAVGGTWDDVADEMVTAGVVTSRYDCRDQAIKLGVSMRRQSGQRRLGTPRKCLSCRETFNSEHVGHRICAQCKGRDVWNGGPSLDDHDFQAVLRTAIA